MHKYMSHQDHQGADRRFAWVFQENHRAWNKLYLLGGKQKINLENVVVYLCSLYAATIFMV